MFFNFKLEEEEKEKKNEQLHLKKNVTTRINFTGEITFREISFVT